MKGTSRGLSEWGAADAGVTGDSEWDGGRLGGDTGAGTDKRDSGSGIASSEALHITRDL